MKIKKTYLSWCWTQSGDFTSQLSTSTKTLWCEWKTARLRVKQVGASKNICLKIKLVGKDVFVTAATDFCSTKKKIPSGPAFHEVVCVQNSIKANPSRRLKCGVTGIAWKDRSQLSSSSAATSLPPPRNMNLYKTAHKYMDYLLQKWWSSFSEYIWFCQGHLLFFFFFAVDSHALSSSRIVII